MQKHPANLTFGGLVIGDLVVHCGIVVGRIVYITDTFWAGVRDSSGRVDEYQLKYLSLAQ